MEDHSGTAIHYPACGEPHNRVTGGHALKGAATYRKEKAPGRALQPMERTPSKSRFLKGTVAHEGPTMEQYVPEGHHPMERTYAGPVLKELYPMESTHVGAISEGLYTIRETSRWSRGRV